MCMHVSDYPEYSDVLNYDPDYDSAFVAKTCKYYLLFYVFWKAI
jgi:hypothetical protein